MSMQTTIADCAGFGVSEGDSDADAIELIVSTFRAGLERLREQAVSGAPDGTRDGTRDAPRFRIDWNTLEVTTDHQETHSFREVHPMPIGVDFNLEVKAHPTAVPA